MMSRSLLILTLFISLLASSCKAQSTDKNTIYTYKRGDINGTGKWYLGREIAHVMGYQGMSWLDRPEREREEHVTQLMHNMRIRPTDHIADIGAGSGHHVFKMTDLARNGIIYAVDIQAEMLAEIERKQEENKVDNIQRILGTERSTNLPDSTLDKVLMVDVYHEFSFPVEMIASIKQAMKPDGKLYLIEYRGEDDTVPIKKVHKMTEKQAVKEMEAAGFVLLENIDNLPWQHCMIFGIKP
ncbi:MAG: methyltransferase domain-containing protein [Bacteroidota bacterium]